MYTRTAAVAIAASAALGPRAPRLASYARDASVDVPTDVQHHDARPGGPCTAQLVVTTVRRNSPTCWLDESVSATPGTLRWDCSGTGAADATFGPHHFTGTVRRGVVALAIHTTFAWEDGCRWQSTQTITGPLASHALAFEYHEAAVQGAACLPPCSADATVDVR